MPGTVFNVVLLLEEMVSLVIYETNTEYNATIRREQAWLRCRGSGDYRADLGRG